jgi:hypothetical protein
MPSKATLVKIGIAMGAVIGGAVAGAFIAAPVISSAQSGNAADALTSTVDDAVGSVADTASDATGGASNAVTDPIQGAVDTAQDPTSGRATAGDDPAPGPRGPHAVGDCTEESLSSADEAKVRAAVEKEVPGATIERIETECDGNGTYEAHLTKSDGTRATAYLNDSFEVTSVQDGGPGGPGHGRGTGGPGQPAPDGQQDGGTSDSNA